MTVSPSAPPILIVAVDGLDWHLLLPAMQEGKVPHLLQLARRGTAARLTTFEPTDSPVIWTSVATGKRKEKHGIHSFAQRVDGRLIPMTSNQRLARPFWDILGEAGDTVATIGWWVTWPAEPLNGWMVAPVASLTGRTWKGSLYPDMPEQTWPPDLLDEIRPVIRRVEREAPALLAQRWPSPPGSIPDWVTEFRRDLGWTIATDRIFTDVAEEILRRHHPRVLAVYQGAIDVAGHRFWGYTFNDGEPSARPHLEPGTTEVLAGYLPTLVENLDDALGKLLAIMPKGSDVLILSDHGMHGRLPGAVRGPGRHPLARYNTGAHGNAPDGVFIAAGPSFRVTKPAFTVPSSVERLPRLGDELHPSVLDITPTLLALHGLPAAADMDGIPLDELLVGRAGMRSSSPKPVTYEKGPPPLSQPRPIHGPADDDVIRRLRSLGYLDGR
ncbi:MAG: alkaline phosphatase family protein [Acidobacteriota bacterium]